MSRYYTCSKCKGLVKEGTDCKECNQEPRTAGTMPSTIGVSWITPFAWPDPDDVNYTQPGDDGTSD